MTRIHFEVPGNPKAQKRHKPHVRAYGKGKYHIHSEDPSESDKADFLALCRDNAPEKPIEGAVVLYVVFWMPIPKGTSQKKVKGMRLNFYDGMEPEGVTSFLSKYGLDKMPPSFHLKRPDYDNLVKMVKDALTGIYWKDDSQVQGGGTFKIYSHRPRTEIEIIY